MKSRVAATLILLIVAWLATAGCATTHRDAEESAEDQKAQALRTAEMRADPDGGQEYREQINDRHAQREQLPW